MRDGVLGLVGCGQLGGAIGRAVLRGGFPADRLWIANRSGPHPDFASHPQLHWTNDIQELASSCEAILLALPPVAANKLTFSVPGRLVISVMAGIDCDQLVRLSGSSRVVRAMSSPAAEIGLAFSPWFARPEVTDDDRRIVRALFEACGVTDEVPQEGQIDCFTAVTGPVPGFVAFFADCVARYTLAQGVAPEVAQRAVRQLFLAGGQMLAASSEPPAAHVQAMIDYAGTTAAGLNAMKASNIADAIADGLEAARLKTLTIGKPPASEPPAGEHRD